MCIETWKARDSVSKERFAAFSYNWVNILWTLRHLLLSSLKLLSKMQCQDILVQLVQKQHCNDFKIITIFKDNASNLIFDIMIIVVHLWITKMTLFTLNFFIRQVNLYLYCRHGWIWIALDNELVGLNWYLQLCITGSEECPEKDWQSSGHYRGWG